MIALLLQVRVLVEEGKADLAVTDRWGATPLDEAMRVGSRATMDYLQVRNFGIGPISTTSNETLNMPCLASSNDNIIQYRRLRSTSPPT